MSCVYSLTWSDPSVTLFAAKLIPKMNVAPDPSAERSFASCAKARTVPEFGSVVESLTVPPIRIDTGPPPNFVMFFNNCR
ncbi:hypothetical protein LMG28688_01425 [Paraburkholderia caffeinitolerans]|uniref:Uncharacterized protein n=2 Tax=Paraburkholderia TaxID=1822464 RepID=A0A6J5FNP8_9BURK|nr:hypothetical protein GCM10011400_60840 [Paraburkholderia caffeinilytica]CAB3782086.1 hypothetical protein LMG28688_01425 [Paraburkholderia caffeinitolerans]